MAFLRRTVPFVPILLAGLVTGCLESPHVRAARIDTIPTYREFLREYPDHPEAEGLEVRLAELEFEEARRLHTIIAYKRFLEEFPESPKARDARRLLEGLRFNAARERGTTNGWRQFLKDHPNGAQRDEARRLLAEAELKELSTTSNPERLARAIGTLPDDERRAVAERRLDDETFSRARETGAAKLLDYLESFPAGRHREEARTLLHGLELDALLDSDRLEEARALAARSPLTAGLKELDQRFARVERRIALRSSTDPLVRAALAQSQLRPVRALVGSLRDPDPQNRWEAAEELGHHVTTEVIEPLLDELRTAHNALIRQRAFEALGRVLKALPPAVAEYEVAIRLDKLARTASSPVLHMETAVLLDLSGRLDDAAAAYQKAFDPNLPDPVVLQRWVEIRRQRGEWFSAAVAARQLSLWARQVADEEPISEIGGVPRRASRSLCAAALAARFAEKTIVEAGTHRTEFPQDLVEFARLAEDNRRLADARLADAELLLKTQDPSARGCDDRNLAERLAKAEAARLAAVASLATRPGATAAAVLELVRSRDPSPEVRAKARSLLAADGPE